MQVLILDDWGITPLIAKQRRDLLEILDDRHGRASAIGHFGALEKSDNSATHPAIPTDLDKTIGDWYVGGSCTDQQSFGWDSCEQQIEPFGDRWTADDPVAEHRVGERCPHRGLHDRDHLSGLSEAEDGVVIHVDDGLHEATCLG
jgi:hypothetical protein